MSIEDAITEAVQTIPECVAGGYVEMSTGILLGTKASDQQPAEVLGQLTGATSELFQGANVTALEKMFRKSKGGDSAQQRFDEIVVFSDNHVHVFLRGQRRTDHAVVFVCRKSANLGMVLTRSRLSLPQIENAV